MAEFIGFIKDICFVGFSGCNLGGGERPDLEILNGVVNNGIFVSHEGIIVVHNGG